MKVLLAIVYSLVLGDSVLVASMAGAPVWVRFLLYLFLVGLILFALNLHASILLAVNSEKNDQKGAK